MKKTYHIVTRAARESAAVIEQFCQTNGQILLPIVNLIQDASQVVETVIHEIGHQMLEQILVLSAEQVAGARTPGKASGDIRYHGSQPGCVQLADRKVKVKRPRLRHKTEGEVKIPAYEMLRQDRGLGQHMLGALLRGVSTREYQEVLPQMAETVGVSRSAISRKAVEASAEQLQQLQERRWEERRDSGDLHRWSALRRSITFSARWAWMRKVRSTFWESSPERRENAASVKRLLTHLRDHGSADGPQISVRHRWRQGVRAAIEEVFGNDQPVQRCRNHKVRNVIDELPKEQHGQALNLMRAAWKVKTAEEGEKRLEQLARFLERDHESAARSLREGMKEMFTLQRLKIPGVAAQMPGDHQHHRKPARRG